MLLYLASELKKQKTGILLIVLWVGRRQTFVYCKSEVFLENMGNMDNYFAYLSA